MFSVRLVTADSYQATPLPQLDPTYSEFRGAEIKNVPIVRVFGTTPTGEKTCLHLHGAFPYMYVPFTGEDNANAYAYKLAASLDAAINISLGSATSNTQHVYQIQRVAGIPYYGYHRREHQFFKVSFYNPAMMKKATDLIQNGLVLNHRLQTHEAHIPFILQFMMDHNLHGMSLINLSNIKYRHVTPLHSETMSTNDSIISRIENADYMPISVVRQSTCELEVDALISDILNRQELEKGIELNPGLAAIWEEERARRIQTGLPSDNSQLVNPQSPKRPAYRATESDIYQQQRLNRRLQMISQCDESTLSTNTTPTPYPLEVNDDDQLINASNLGSCSANNLDSSQQQLNDVTSLTPFSGSQRSKNSQSTHDSSILDAEDMPIVEMLMELARDAGNQDSIDDDSVLGTQSSIFNNGESKSDNEDEEDAAELNITCLQLDSMSPWEDIEKSPSQLVPVKILEVNTQVPQTSLGDIFAQDTDAESQDSEESRLPQLDGAGDLSSFLESEEDESVKTSQELKRVSECQMPILNNNLSNNDEAFIVEELLSGLSKTNNIANSTTAFIPDGTWPSYLPNDTGLEQFDTMNYEPLGSVFDFDFDNIMGMSLLLSNNDETSVGINLTVQDEGIPLEAVLNGDPCFTQTAEMDKSDFAELQDQYVSLVDSALVPDVYKNLYDSDIVNSNCDRLEEKEMVPISSRNFRFTSNSRDSNLSSENVTPNIQEPDAKVCKNKLSVPSAFDRIDENCKDFSRLPSDSSDFNCNVVATWEELQDPKFIPKRILKRKRFGKTRKRVLTRCPKLSDSLSARRRGRLRRGLTNVTSHIVQDNVIHILDSSSNTSINSVPLEINNKAKESPSHEKLSANDHTTSITVGDIGDTSEDSPTAKLCSEDLLQDVATSGDYEVPKRISPSILDSGLTQNILHEILSSDSVSNVRDTLPDIESSTKLVDEHVVTSILANVEELLDVPTETKILIDNNTRDNCSHYSSTRAHSGVIPFVKHNHRHCYYSYMRMEFIQDYIFTSDEIWVIEKRKRGKLRPLSPVVCNNNCRLPFVPLQKLEMDKSTQQNMTQLSVNEVALGNFNSTCDSSKVVVCEDAKSLDDSSTMHELSQSKSPANIDTENMAQDLNHDEKLSEKTKTNCKIMAEADDNIICDKKQLPINDSSSTQSAQISSTQNYDQCVVTGNTEPIVISKVLEDNSYNGRVGRKKRSIILKLGDKHKTDVINSNGCSPNIVAFSMRSNNNDRGFEKMTERRIQPELAKKKREKRKKIKYADAAMIAIIKSNGADKLFEEENGNSVLTSFTPEGKASPLCHKVVNKINEDGTKIPGHDPVINREFNIISSSQSESAILGKRPKIWCSIDRSKVDLTFVTAKSNGIDSMKNIVNTSEFVDNAHRTLHVCSEPIANQIFVDNNDVNLIAKSDIVTNSHVQQFDEFDDTTLDVHLCDSIYKDDVTSNNIFEAEETIGEHAPSTDNCGNDHESEQYTNAVAEANFYAGKDYTIDAISLEIPLCLFEEDSNSESVQRKPSDLSNDNTLNAQSVQESSTPETTLNRLISGNCDSMNTEASNLEELHKRNGDILSPIDNSLDRNMARHEISTLNDVREPLTMLRPTELVSLINGNESSSGSMKTSTMSRTSTLEQLYSPTSCHVKSKYCFDEEMIVRMMNSILVLRENNEALVTNDSLSNKKKMDHCGINNTMKVTMNDEVGKNLDFNSSKNVNENTVSGPVFKYSPNKISIIRRIYSSKNKIVPKESNNIIATASINSTMSRDDANKLCNNQKNSSKVKEFIEEKKNDEKLLDNAISEVNDDIEDIEIHNNKNKFVLDTQENPENVSMSLENSNTSKPIDELIHESNNNKVVCQFAALAVNDKMMTIENSVDQNFKGNSIIDESHNFNIHHQKNNSPDKSIEEINKRVDEVHANDHNGMSHVVAFSTNNQYLTSDAIINTAASSVNLGVDVDVNADKIETGNCPVEENFVSLKSAERDIKCNSVDKKLIESSMPSTAADVADNNINHSTSIALCREVSIVLERVELNSMNKYLKSNQNVEVCDMDVSKNMASKAKNMEKKCTTPKKCVRFNEQVFVFEADEYVSLIDVEDKMTEKDNLLESMVEKDNLTEVLEITEDGDEIRKSNPRNFKNFASNKEPLIISKNAIVICDKLIDGKIFKFPDNTKMKDNKITEEMNVNEKKVGAEGDCVEVIKHDFKKFNGVSLQASINNYNNTEIDMLSENNTKISTENIAMTCCQPKITNIVVYENIKCNSDVAVNQNAIVQIKKFDSKFKDIEKKGAAISVSYDKLVNGHGDVNCVNKKQSVAADIIQIKNNTLIDKLVELRDDNIGPDKPLTVHERKTKAMSHSNGTSVIPTDEVNSRRADLRFKRKRNNISTTQTQSIINDSANNISFVDDAANPYECFQNSDRILRSYRTSSGYRNKIHTVSIDDKMVFTKVTISDQELLRKSPKERFLGNIGLCSLKPRGCGWLPEHTMSGSIQLQQPHVVLQRLTPSVLKYYGYTRRFKSNKFGKRFKTNVNQFTIPAYDGPADLSSSDSDLDSDRTGMNVEKRVCVYRSCKKNTEHEAIVTPKKRKQSQSDDDDDDDDEEVNKCKHSKYSSPRQSIAALKMSYRSPRRRSSGVSGNYSPLKITVTSPTVRKDSQNDSVASQIDTSNPLTNFNTTCTTPRRRKRLMHENLFRNRIMASPAGGQLHNVRELETNVKQQLMGELDILETSVTVPTTQSLSALSPNVCQMQDVSPNVMDAMNVRKNLFISTLEDNALVEVSSLQHNAKINEKDSDIATPSTSGYINLNVGNVNNDPECEDDEDSTMFEQSSDEICLKYSPSIHSGELNINSQDELCNITFTQYLSSHELTQQAISSSDCSEIQTKSKQPVTLVSKLSPPSCKRIIDTMERYNIPKFKNLQPFFSNQADAPGQKELAHRMLNVPGKGVTDLLVFKSTMENITGINRWRRMKINEFQPASGVFKSKSIRQSLAGHASVVITPLLSAPTRKNVMKWLRAREYLEEKRKKEEASAIAHVELQINGKNRDDLQIILDNECSNVSDSSIVEGSPQGIVMSSYSSRFLGRTPNSRKKDLQKDDTITKSSNSDEVTPSLKSILGKTALFKTTEQPMQLGISCDQIECVTNTTKSNATNENMQKCKALTMYQFITILCVEVHVITRDDLLPDPQHDSISALFYAIQSDVPPTSAIKPLEHGVIAICAANECKKSCYSYGSNVPFVMNFVADEKKLFETFINMVNRSDAEILIGWEIESLSWGYIFQRASKLGINLAKDISRVPASQTKWDNLMSNVLDSLTDIKLPGRIVLDIWRIMKSEIALLTYTFENVMYHVMNERLPCPSYKSLSKWWQLTQSRWKVVQHYCTKLLGILRILEQLDIVGRTSEYARLFGIQFYEVFSRGSQYRVESIMLRLAKPLNYVAVSPSAQQRSSMRAMEALPLILEPESMFYGDPVIVLDFQSLYPSIIIAHNYCFSTCLGRVEHIGQPDPFEFGATTLRVPKHMALKMKGKVNYAPCGVAFVKPEVRQGILPRMLTEILNTRFMVKKAMKDYSQNDKLLQRVLHSRQKGLKDLANVTYGYTAANFTGRMPCIEVGDSVVSKAKETLERAIKMVESTPKWGARVIYGDTDSLFILVPGKSKDDAFNVGYEIADAVTASNLSPIKLKFEKILYPAILQTKKRYCGYMYETPDQKEPKYLAKGIETVRRDGCPAVSKILEKSLKILFNTKDVSLVKQYVTRQLDKVLNGKVSLEDLTFAKEFRGLKGYKDRACVPALELTRRLMKRDPRALPRRSERVRYVIVAGAPNEALIHCVRSPWELINDPGLRPNGIYYVTRVIIPPLNRCLNLMGVDVNAWYKEMPHRQTLKNPVAIPDNKQKQTISQYFGTIVCVSCGRPSNKGICTDCLAHPTDTLIMLHERLRWLERINDHVTGICQSCVGRGDIADCVSLDCPVLYRRAEARRDLSHGTELRRIIEAGGKLEF